MPKEFTKKQIAKIVSHGGGSKNLAAILDHSSKLSEPGFTAADVVKIVSHHGGSKTLQIPTKDPEKLSQRQKEGLPNPQTFWSYQCESNKKNRAAESIEKLALEEQAESDSTNNDLAHCRGLFERESPEATSISSSNASEECFLSTLEITQPSAVKDPRDAEVKCYQSLCDSLSEVGPDKKQVEERSAHVMGSSSESGLRTLQQTSSQTFFKISDCLPEKRSSQALMEDSNDSKVEGLPKKYSRIGEKDFSACSLNNAMFCPFNTSCSREESKNLNTVNLVEEEETSFLKDFTFEHSFSVDEINNILS